MDPATLYAMFDGDDIDGKRYALGDPIDADINVGVRNLLVAQGRISSAKPDGSGIVTDTTRNPADMSRAELLAELSSDMPDDKLADAVAQKRAQQADTDDDGEDESYAALKDRDPATLKTAELAIVAEAEGVTFSDDDKTNALKAAAIVSAREAKAKG